VKCIRSRGFGRTPYIRTARRCTRDRSRLPGNDRSDIDDDRSDIDDDRSDIDDDRSDIDDDRPNPASPVGPSSRARGSRERRARGLFRRSRTTPPQIPSIRETLDELATRFAPTLFFDSAEPWFPTDPRPYTVEEDDETVVDGFVAFDGYHERYDEAGEPPNPTVFYNGVQYEDSPLAVVQFWLYSAFDQFTANFHWHDWEVLHVFVDLDTGDPQLYVASSHSRSVPNNEFLDPNPDAIPRVLSELGSHSSTLSVNENPGQFQRVGEEGLLADITNTTIDTVEDLLGIPIAYGLPATRGCGSRSSFPSTRANRSTITRTSRRSRSSRWSTARSRFDRSTHWDRPRPTFRSETESPSARPPRPRRTSSRTGPPTR